MKLPTIPPGLADDKIPPALGTNHIAGFGGFRPLSSLEKKNNNNNNNNNYYYY